MKIILEQSDDDLQKHPGMLLIDNLLNHFNFSLFNSLSNKTQNKRWIPNSSIIKSCIFLQCFAMPDFHDVKEMCQDSLFTSLIGFKLSPETYRLRMDFLAKEKNIHQLIDSLTVNILKNVTFNTITINKKEYYTLDIDVTPFENPNVKKEGISCTYKKIDGYAPIMAYLCQYALCFDLREGSQHSEKGAVEFLNRVLDMVHKIGIPMDKILVRVDSAHDDAKFTDACIHNHVKFIIKRNHRKETYTEIIAAMRANIKPIESRHGNHNIYFCCNKNIFPSNAEEHDLYVAFKLKEKFTKNSLLSCLSDKDKPCELVSYWTNLDIIDSKISKYFSNTSQECDRLYRDHATCEQYHSEIKSDMNMELLPSKYFATNKLFLHIATVSFNILRIIGDHAIHNDKNFQHHKNEPTIRIRLRTVIDKICTIAYKIVHHARKIFIKFGKNAFFYDTFVKIYRATS